MLILDSLLYTEDHLWIEIKGEIAKVGLTDYAQELIGAISYIELPAKGDLLTKQSKLFTIEGLKSVIDISTPFGCTILRVNDALKKEPKLVNSSPYSEGWIAELTLPDPKDRNTLLTATAYKSKISDQ
jgi:glycine cleavage system H protein